MTCPPGFRVRVRPPLLSWFSNGSVILFAFLFRPVSHLLALVRLIAVFYRPRCGFSVSGTESRELPQAASPVITAAACAASSRTPWEQRGQGSAVRCRSLHSGIA